MGRPSKYTPELLAKLCDVLEKGLPIKLACDCVGIGDTTYHRWAQEFGEFRDATTRARSTGCSDTLAVIKGAAQSGDWKAAEAWLKLTQPTYFRNQIVESKVEVTDNREDIRRIIEEEIPDPATRKRLALKLVNGGIAERQAS